MATELGDQIAVGCFRPRDAVFDNQSVEANSYTQIGSFSQLMQLDLSNNSCPLSPSVSFIFNAHVDYLYMESDAVSAASN
jgi:hypothetical protein